MLTLSVRQNVIESILATGGAFFSYTTMQRARILIADKKTKRVILSAHIKGIATKGDEYYWSFDNVKNIEYADYACVGNRAVSRT